MRHLLVLLALALALAWQAAPALAEGVSSRDLVPDSEIAPAKKEAPASAQITKREAKPGPAQEESRKSKGKDLGDPVVGDVIVSGKAKDVMTLSGSKGTETQSNVGSINVSK
jgi:hypothetical protein